MHATRWSVGCLVQPVCDRRCRRGPCSPAKIAARGAGNCAHARTRQLQLFRGLGTGQPEEPRQVRPRFLRKGVPGVSEPAGRVAHPGRVLFALEWQLAEILQLLLLRQLHRSEEHTSELQSLMRISYAVFCLKKKNISNIT